MGLAQDAAFAYDIWAEGHPHRKGSLMFSVWLEAWKQANAAFGSRGGKTSSANMSKSQRTKRAKKAAKARWTKC